ncbi:FliM/FliN family flagellar motor C-terminal domain-containing protein [Piscinibacter gummiphilus]|uniref:Uncharacterized protein n=1 Tax=Piscinibacter gummiphilus TaxID=946333 RepID=A0A1W6L590_9BURK|nr:FliM/FliN family flagellar motor C-terminal domain-containing protein [Piscinibacter gummiphilus]ARN19340.1 hypothetical protein A4W93_05125 [Piscinibacter gummiphilus]ATU64007.1 hypothetical protein CPZ87_05210 [Piscinibacter gummiphilus]GLS93033.1 hypothetical protein GCM10007918_03240 [Piscinibacter gummiphilus]
MNDDVRPFLLLGDHELGGLEAHLRPVLDVWRRAWTVDATGAMDIVVTVWRPDSTRPLAGTEWCGVDGRVWIADAAPVVSPAWLAVLGRRFDAAGADDGWARAAFAEAVAARDRAVAEALVGAVSATTRRPVDPQLARPGSGAVRIVADAAGLDLVADAGALSRLPPRVRAAALPSPRSDVLSAAAGASVRLTVEAGQVDLDVARLLSLQPGDVIRLPTRLSDPLPVAVADRVIAMAALGHVGPDKAVQFVSPPRIPREPS